MALAPIINSSETINADAAPSLNAAFVELHAAFGFWPIVLAPYGGARTEAEQAHLVSTGQSDTMNSDHREDAVGRAAADIDNHDRFRAANQDLFLAILTKYGWHNMTNDGEPFPREKWHFAKHGLAPASGNESPITYHQEDPMAHPAGIVYRIINPSGGGLHGVKIVAGATLTVLPSDSVADFVAGLLNHGLEGFPDYRAPKTGTPDILPKDDPGQGEGTPLPIMQANSDWLAAMYGPQIPGGTIAHLWGLASASGQPATYRPATV